MKNLLIAIAIVLWIPAELRMYMDCHTAEEVKITAERQFIYDKDGNIQRKEYYIYLHTDYEGAEININSNGLDLEQARATYKYYKGLNCVKGGKGIGSFTSEFPEEIK